MSREFDVVVVGAGLGGCVAALTAARRGRTVALIERGRRPGSKNVIGGVLYTPVLGRLLPDFAASAPIERPIISRTLGFLANGSHLSVEIRSDTFAQAPHFNRSFTVRRTAFDPWLVSQVRQAGVTVVPMTVVESLLHDNEAPAGRVMGVRCGRQKGDIRASVVILAEGANALLAEREGLRPMTKPDQVMLGVKQVLGLDAGKIEDRFAIDANAGRAIELFGGPARGGFGSGFLYTNAESVSVGVTISLAHLARLGARPDELLDAFKAHPSVRPYIRGGEPLEYCAHLLPIGAGDGMPERVRDGLLLVGDAARLANMSHYKELSNLVTASGEAAGEAAADAIERGDTSATGLAAYERRLAQGFVLRDLKKYAGVAALIESSPELLERYPRLLVESLVDHFTLSERSKDQIEREILRKWNREAKPAEIRAHLVDVLDAVGFSLVPLMKRALAPTLTSTWGWLKLLLPWRRRRRP